MKSLAISAALLIALQPNPSEAQPAPARTAQAASVEALIDRFIAVLPDQEEISRGGSEIDPAELARLSALNPGKEPKVRSILQANLACSGPAVTAATLRMLRTIGRNLGEARLRKLVGFYEGPDYTAFGALVARMEGNPTPAAADRGAMAKLMEAYPLQAFYDQISRAEEMFMADQVFTDSAMKCASAQMEALDAAGLKSN